MTSAMAVLRQRTMDAHARLDVAFGAYDLADKTDYCAFLRAHARALPAAEAIIATDAVPRFRARTPLLRADMEKLAQAMPVPRIFAGSGEGAFAWGVLYVVEGSRLGGGILVRRVAAGLPTNYLAASHQPGEWRALGEAINAEAQCHGQAWLDQAAAAAEACFELFRGACAAAAG